MRSPTNPRDHERGSIAIMVLWGMALIFALLAAAGVAGRTEVRIARGGFVVSRVRYAAEAGTQLGLARLLRRRAAGAAVFDGTPERWQDGSIRVAISIADDAGKIDLNEAPLLLLQGLFTAVGRPSAEALLLACDIVAHRGGSLADCPDSEDAGDGTLPRPHRFVVPEELTALPGFDDSLYAAIADCVTTATGAAGIDPRDASRAVLLAIPGATPELVDAYLANRAMWHDLAAAGETLIPLPAASFLTVSPERNFTISAVATSEGARFRADLQIRLTEEPSRPYEIVAWRMPPAGPGALPPPARRVP